MLDRLLHFFAVTLWQGPRAGQPWPVRAGRALLRFASLTVRCCLRDGTMLHASALTYITMLAIVPVLTLCLTSLKAFGAGALAEEKIMANIEVFVGQMADAGTAEALPGPQDAPSDSAQTAEALRAVCRAVFDQIDSINFAQIGIVGAVALIFMVIGVLGRIESSFNAIWGLRANRPIWRKFTDYLSVLIIAPLLVLAATTLPVLDGLARAIPDLWGLRAFVEALGILNALVPLLLGTLLFAFLFGFLPNTRVRIPSCFIGAFVTVLALTLFFRLCMLLQIGIANYSSLYGSLVALPVLLFWIYASWQIILFGAEICFVHQHYAELCRENAFAHPSQRDRIVLALALVLGAARAVEQEGGALRLRRFADALALPRRDVLRVADILERRNILLPVAEGRPPVVAGYVLARCATRLTVADVINACLDDSGGEALLARAADTPIQAPLAAIESRFSAILSGQFAMTIAQALQSADIREPAP